MVVPPLALRDPTPRPDATASLRTRGVVQIPDFLTEDSAAQVARVLAGLPYMIVASDETGGSLVISDTVVRQFGEAQVRKFLGETVRRASEGFAFIHQAYPLQDELARDPGNPAADVTRFLESRAFLDVGEALTGVPIGGVRVQASHYRRGDFLTLHDDSHTRDDRVAAFTLGFTTGWRADWGGQLLFHDARGDVAFGFVPRFNVLTVFSVPIAHSVAPVAPYAAQPRLSLTGWFLRGQG